jgi:thiol-disulfide isomerase/thioredoxin/uncharacterized protein (DUF1697 family)
MILPSHNLCLLTRYNIKLIFMKKIIGLITLVILFAGLTGYSQNRSITFIDKPFQELMTMAKEQQKLIFVDGYTSWCGPCKWMAANMFTNDSIADYYNKTFICAHFDMEKGEGVEVAKVFQVRAYPTLLFINASGEMVHMRVGAPQKVSDYIDMGMIALAPGEGFSGCAKKFQAGDRDPQFMLKYLDRLQGAYMPVNEPLSQYFASQKESDMLNRVNWTIIYEYVTDMDSKEFGFLLGHQKEYAKLYTKDSVNQKLSNVYTQAIMSASRSRSFSDASYNELKKKIRDSGFEGAEKVIFTGDLTIFQMKGEIDKFVALAYSGLDTHYSDDYTMLMRMAAGFLQLTQEKKNLEKAATWAKKSISLKSTSENNDTYANLMFKLGNKDEAVKYERKALELAKQEKVSTAAIEASLKKFQEK